MVRFVLHYDSHQEEADFLNIKQINYFISVANHGSLSAAAREYNISVQAISKAMTNLEEEFGENLFIRSHQGISLTPLGKTFLEKAEPVRASFKELEDMGETHAEQQTKLRLFLCSPAFCHNVKARAAMANFFDKFLDAKTEVSIGTGEAGLECIRSDGCDALITIGQFNHPDFDSFSIGTVPAGICMAKNHPLAKEKSVSLEQLEPYSFILSKQFDRFNDSILVTYQREGLKSSIIEPTLFDAPRQFYIKHAMSFMVNISSLGEMLPRSIMVPLVPKDTKAIPICLVTMKSSKSISYQRMEQLLKRRL